MGMLLDAIFKSTEDETSMSVYLKILGPKSKPIFDELFPLLAESVEIGSIKNSSLKVMHGSWHLWLTSHRCIIPIIRYFYFCMAHRCIIPITRYFHHCHAFPFPRI